MKITRTWPAKVTMPDGSIIEMPMAAPSEFTKALRPYGDRLGRLVFHWNQLHNELALLFGHITTPDNKPMAHALWHSTNSDFQQREMLRVAATHSRLVNTEQRDAIIDVLNTVDSALRHDRNRAIHAPLTHSQRMEGDSLKLWIEADVFSGSPHAIKLSGKDLLLEFKEYAMLAERLKKRTVSITLNLLGGTRLPDKPKLPRAHRTKSRKQASRQSTPK
jgi:hypothetical protein